MFMKPLMMEEAAVARGPKNIVLQILIFILVFIVITIPSQIVVSMAAMPEILRATGELIENPAAAIDPMQIATNILNAPKMMIMNLFLTVFLIAGAIVYCKFLEKRPLGSMGIRKKGAAKHYLFGLLVGFIMIFATFGLGVATGGIAIENATLSVNWPIFVAFLLGFLLQGASEELVFRGYFMNTLGAKCTGKYSVVIAVVISSIGFSIAHLMNPGVTAIAFINLVIYGVFMGCYMITFDNIWGVCGIHSMWNFAQGNILGISVSGVSPAAAIITPSLAEGKTILHGGIFGLEGSALCTAVLIIAITATLLYRRAQTKKGGECSAPRPY